MTLWLCGPALAHAQTTRAPIDQTIGLGGTDDAHPAATGGPEANHLGTQAGTLACPTSTQNGVSMLCVRGRSGTAPDANLLLSANLDGYPNVHNAPMVTLYAGYRGHAGAPEGWALNTVTHLEPGNTGGGIGNEVDLNNWSCDAGADKLPAAAGCAMQAPVGLLVTGASPFPSAAAIAISGVSEQNAQWHDGIAMLGGHVVDRYSIHTETLAPVDYELAGAHLIGIDLSAAHFTQAAIRLSNGQGLAWAPAGAGGLHGLIATAGSVVFTGPAGPTLVIDDAQGVAVPGTLRAAAMVQPLRTPASSSAPCTPGQFADDAAYHYWCAGPNHWLRVKGSEW